VRLTLYYGNDDAYLNMTDEGSLYKLRWSNNLVAINWIHTTRNRKQVRTTAYTSAFGNKFELNFGADRFLLPSSITEMGCGVHASLNVADIGAEYQYDKIEPQHATTNSLNFESSNVAKQYTHMLSAYAQTGEQLCSFVRLGIKTYSYFANDGYNNTSVAPFAKIIWYGEKCLASVCYSKRYQYLHRLGFSTINWPIEFYCATNKYTPLQTSYTIAVQGSIYVFDDKWKIEADLYLMQLRGQATYIGTLMDIAMSGISPSQDIIEGKGRSWGGNVLISRRTATNVLWVGYSYSNSKRTYHTELVDGTFRANHNRPHEVNLVASHRINHVTLGATCVFASGTPFTAPTTFYWQNGNIVSAYGAPNGNHLRPYIRLDISGNIQLRQHKNFAHNINISVYNVQGAFRNNHIYYRLKLKNDEYNYRHVSFFAQVLPSVSYHFEF